MLEKTKILIVDDREENLVALEKILQNLNLQIIRANSGNEALQYMIEHEFALILMDVQMPEMDGFETVQIMRNDKMLASTPVIFISAIYKEDTYNIKGIQSGAVDFIIKPIIPEILLGKIEVFVQLYEDKKKLEHLNIKINNQQKQLIETKQHLLKAQEIAKIGNFSYNLSTNKIMWSDEVYKIHGIEPNSEINFEISTRFIHPDDKVFFNNAMNNALSGNGSDHIDYRIICPDNKVKWIRGQSEMIYDDNNKLSLMYGTVQDITIQKTAELELEWELMVNKSLADLSQNLIIPNLKIKDIAKQVFLASKLLTKSKHGYVSKIEAKENIGQTLSETMNSNYKISNLNNHIIFPCEENGIYPSLPEHSLDTSEPYLTNNFEKSSLNSTLPKEHFPIKNLLSIPVKYNDEIIGQITLANTSDKYTNKHSDAIQRIANLYALAIHRIRDEEEKVKMQEELQQAEKMQVIGQLAGGIAHDFNNQLATIMGNAELALEESNESSSIEKYLSNILVVSKRAADLTGQLLAYARKGNYLKETIEPNKVILEVIAMLERTIDKKIIIKKDLHASGIKISGDPTQIYSAILNISINARDSIKNKGEISFSTTDKTLSKNDLQSYRNSEDIEPGHFIILQISDTGCGIEDEIIDKIFDPFFTTKEQGKGTGMGLSAVLGIVKMHNGIIDVSSKLDSGTTFKLLFPIVNQMSEAHENQENRLPNLKLEGTVLLVDDEEMILELGSTMLNKMGMKALIAKNGKEAIDIYKSHLNDINLIIMDMIMPIMDGKEALEEILKINPNATVIISTGYTNGYNHSDFVNLGAKNMIKKPFKYRELLLAIKDII